MGESKKEGIGMRGNFCKRLIAEGKEKISKSCVRLSHVQFCLFITSHNIKPDSNIFLKKSYTTVQARAVRVHVLL